MEKQLTLFTPELPLPAQRSIKRALNLLDQHLQLGSHGYVFIAVYPSNQVKG